MLDDYRALAVFVAVAEAGSFSEAGRRLKLSTSVVSHHISKLETKLDVTLFFRSTRSLSLTPEAQAILEHGRAMVDAGEAALDALSEISDQPMGSLRVSVPAFGYQGSVHQAMWAFARAHPKVSLSINCNDAPADLVKDRFDLAVRLGVLADSSMKCRRIGDFHLVLVASPEFVETSPVTDPADLTNLPFIGISMIPDQMTLTDGGRTIVVEPEQIRLDVDSVAAAKFAVMAGLGYRHLPMDDIEAELASGALIRLLPDWSVPPKGVFAVWPDVGPQKKLSRRMIDHLADWQFGEQNV